jgi:hypothetical protein
MYCTDHCDSICMTCTIYADFCTKCVSIINSYPVYLIQEIGKCFVQNCPDFYYKNLINSTCESCQNLTNLKCKNCKLNSKCQIVSGIVDCQSED